MNDQPVLAALRMLIGEESLGRVLAAAKVAEEDPVVWLRRAIDDQSTLEVQEKAGWKPFLAREIRPFRLG